MGALMQKLYCYVDETGQDTKGKFFLVSVVIAENERNQLIEYLLEIEEKSKKYTTKWHKSAFQIRHDYTSMALSNSLFLKKIFFSEYKSDAYVDLTILTVAKAILQRADNIYKATIFADGLSKNEIHRFATGLRKLKIRIRKVRGGREQSDPLLRLADAIAGFLRDYREGQSYAVELYRRTHADKIVNEV